MPKKFLQHKEENYLKRILAFKFKHHINPEQWIWIYKNVILIKIVLYKSIFNKPKIEISFYPFSILLKLFCSKFIATAFYLFFLWLFSIHENQLYLYTICSQKKLKLSCIASAYWLYLFLAKAWLVKMLRCRWWLNLEK